MGPRHEGGLSRRAIVEAAVGLLDRLGLDGLTVRRLADELGVRNPSLYWHLKNKQQLLDAVADAIVAETGMAPPLPGESWSDWLRRRARAYRGCLLRHRDGARVVATARALSPATIEALNHDLQILVAFGFTPAAALHTISTLTRFIHGFVLQEQTQPEHRLAPTPGQLAGLADILDDGASAALVTALRDSGGALSEASFDFGIAAIVGGARTRASGPETTPPLGR